VWHVFSLPVGFIFFPRRDAHILEIFSPALGSALFAPEKPDTTPPTIATSLLAAVRSTSLRAAHCRLRPVSSRLLPGLRVVAPPRIAARPAMTSTAAPPPSGGDGDPQLRALLERTTLADLVAKKEAVSFGVL
jgi:hypothetical protein